MCRRKPCAALSKTRGRHQGTQKHVSGIMEVSKPNIFWVPSPETARKIDDEDTVQSNRDRPLSFRGKHGRPRTLLR